MVRFKKKMAHITAAELAAEEARLKKAIAQARLDLASGKAKNTRLVFNLRGQLAIIKSYASSR